MLEWLESIFSSIGQKLAEYVWETGRGIKNFKLTLETVERYLNSLRAKTSDIQEQIKKAQQSGKKKRKRQVENWLEEVQAVEGEFLELVNEVGFIKNFFNGDRARKLNERVDGLLQQSENFGELVLDENEGKGDPLLTASLIGKSSEKKLEEIWNLLVVDKVANIRIYGMGGVGKTTLAKHINNRLLEESQYNVCWVTVSQTCSIKGLQNEIAKTMSLELLDQENEDKRATRLNQALLRRKGTVLILDDVWENICLQKVGDPLHVEGCGLIITSRSLEVCRRIGCQKISLVETLNANDAWNLFQKTLEPKIELDPPVEEIARAMAKKCSGLPLGIITLAGSMRGVTNIHVWKNASVELEESLTEQNEMEDKVFRVLKFSFDRLDPNYRKNNGYTNLQLCFLYCLLYPEDSSLSRIQLIRKFIAEKLMDKRKTRVEEFDQGHTIFEKLANVCLLERHDDYCMRMHDLVRSMALKIASEKPRFMVLAKHSLEEIPNKEEWTEDLEKVSLMDNQISELPPEISPNCPKWSTLLLNDNPLKFIPESFFLKLSGLQVLDLSYTAIRELPNSLSNLESLNALLLRGCRDLVFVPYLGKLKALKELDLSWTRISQVPQGMENLVNLKTLLMFCRNLKMFPAGLLSKYPCLQVFGLSVRVEAPALEIGQLKHLEQFCGRFGTFDDLNLFVRSQKNRNCDVSYNIYVGKTCPSTYGEGGELNRRGVGIFGRNLEKQNEKDTIMLPEDIESLDISHCEGLSRGLLDNLVQLNTPRSLKVLMIWNCKEIECILNEQSLLKEDDELKSCRFLLHTLEYILLYGLPNFKGIDVGFSSLRSLNILRCHKIKTLLRGADLQNIENISIENCEEIEEIIQVADDTTEGGVVSFPKLRYLQLEHLPRLTSICKATMVCSISSITLCGCPNLTTLPFLLPGPPAVCKINLFKEEKEWWESVEWKHPIQRDQFVIEWKHPIK